MEDKVKKISQEVERENKTKTTTSYRHWEDWWLPDARVGSWSQQVGEGGQMVQSSSSKVKVIQ